MGQGLYTSLSSLSSLLHFSLGALSLLPGLFPHNLRQRQTARQVRATEDPVAWAESFHFSEPQEAWVYQPQACSLSYSGVGFPQHQDWNVLIFSPYR